MNSSYVSARYYRAPELMLCITKYTCAIDIWCNFYFSKIKFLAAGVILTELIMKDPIF